MIRLMLPKLTFVGILEVAIAGSLAACGGPPESAASPAGAGSSVSVPSPDVLAKEPGEAKVGDKTKCPVSGEEMTVEASSPHAEYEGKTYYFCCAVCKKKFEADPAKYVKKS